MSNTINSLSELFSKVEFWSTTIGAILGGGLAVWASFSATQAAHRFAEKKHKHDEKMRLKRILQALSDELETVWDLYNRQIGPLLDELEDVKPVEVLWRNVQDYFTVYHTNADNIGLIENEKLRKILIETYANAKGTIDSFLMNNDLLTDYRERVIKYETTKLEFDKKLADDAFSSLVTYAKYLKANNMTLKQLFDELQPMLKEEVKRLTEETNQAAIPWWKRCYGCSSAR